MSFQLDQHTKKIIYALFIPVIYLVLFLLVHNPLVALIITLNIFYFTRELLYKQLFLPQADTEHVPEQDTDLPSSSYPLLQSEAEQLPEFIKKTLAQNQEHQQAIKQTIIQPTITSTPSSTVDLTQPTTPSEERFFTSIQTAELLIDKKIKELETKRTIRKEDVKVNQQELKEEVAKSLPEVPKDQWTNWNPLTLQEKVKTLGIYCEKCDQTIELQKTIYEITKASDHYDITAVHDQAGEQHTLTAKVTLETFEILARPVVTVDQPKEVEA